MRFIRQGICLWAAAILALSGWCHAQSATPDQEYQKLIQVDQNIQPLGEHPFGENISLYDGSISFNVTDVSLRGNGPTLTVGRTGQPFEWVFSNNNSPQLSFSNWDLDIPRIETLVATQLGWQTGLGGATPTAGTTKRCSNFTMPPGIASTSSQGGWVPDEWWFGYNLFVPGEGKQLLMPRSAANSLSPTISGMSFSIVTKNNWMIGCGVTASDGGEGFLAIAPDGTRYTFAHLVYRPWYPIIGAGALTPDGIHVATSNAVSAKNATPMVGAPGGVGILNREDALMYVTQVQDRFGNTLTYNYDPGTGYLSSITASDGREVDVTYVSGSQTIQTITAKAANVASRTWMYTYGAGLTGVQLPDGSAWSYNNLPIGPVSINPSSSNCQLDQLPSFTYPVATGVNGTITAPSGLTGTFGFGGKLSGRSYTPKACYGNSNGTAPSALYPEWSIQYAITSEVLSGAGMPMQTWNYSYSPANQSWSNDSCATGGTCATTVYTDVIDPNGNDTRYTFSNRYDASEGQLKETDYYVGSTSGTLMRSDIDTYANPVGGPWPATYGADLLYRDNQSQVQELSPLSQRVIKDVPNGDTYTWLAEAFNAYAQVTKTKRYNSISYEPSIEEQTSYVNDTAYWVLGLPQEVDNLSTGETESLDTYSPIDTLLTRSRFGELLMSYTFDGQGNLSTFKDGNNNTTTLSNYYRGIPRLISYPDNTTKSLSVDDLSQIQSITDQNGNTTSYSYDMAGRVNSITYPANDDVNWYPTTIAYNLVGSERGLTGNHWRRTSTTGNYQELTYFDAKLQPVLADSHIISGGAVVGGSDITAEKQYDFKGQTTFASYPVQAAPNYGDSAIASGTHSTYDALERLSQSQQDSELGTLTTSIAYSYGARKLVTDPKGNLTTTAYQVFDQPVYDAPIQVLAPTGITQNIGRDLYGNPTSLSQSGTYSGQNVSLTRNLTYDGYHRLCRVYEPESNSTVYSYDGANNIAWLATGQSIAGDGTVCGTGQVGASAMTTRTYDALNRIKTETPPAGTQSTTYQYDPTGRLTITNTGIVIQGHTYNKRGLLTGESQWIPGDNNYVRSIGYGYDAYGHLSTLVYPDGGVFGMFPDARGRATLVQGGNTLYASNISYYPDGGTAGYSLNNGVTASIQRNTRQLPSNITYNQGGNLRFSEAYVYDADANLTAVTDLINGKNTQTLGYDGLNRLTSDAAPNSWGAESFTYDPLNNIRSHVAAGLTLSLNYDGTNRMATETQGTPTGGPFANYQYDVRGNQIQSNVVFTSTPHTFDAKNQLLQIPGVATYSYDEAGRRIKKVLANGQVSYFFYSQAGQLLYAYNATTGQPTDYLYLNGKLVVRYLASQNPTYLLTDRLGTPVRETDPSGALSQTFSYRPFGQLYSGPSQQQPGYTGHVLDPESNLSYMQARYQDGGLGQFLSVDPVGPVPGDVLSFNRYAYGSNNPTCNTDPTGMAPGDADDNNGSAFPYTNTYFDGNGGSGGGGSGTSVSSPQISDVFSHYQADKLGNTEESSFPSFTSDALIKILNSPIGQRIAGAVMSSGEKINLALEPSGMDPVYHWDAGSGAIVYSQNLSGYISTHDSKGQLAGEGLDTVLIHEMGHTPQVANAFGYPYSPNFDLPNEFNVIRFVENPYRQSIGLRLRSYYGPYPVPPPLIQK